MYKQCKIIQVFKIEYWLKTIGSKIIKIAMLNIEMGCKINNRFKMLIIAKMRT